jgi:hypothetical protein
MTVAEILEQARTLSWQERKELVKSLIDTLGEPVEAKNPKTGADIIAKLEEVGPIEFVDPHIEDSVEWVKAQRQKQADRLKPYWDDEQ